MTSKQTKTVEKRSVSLEDVIQRPAPGLSAPASIQFSPDGGLVTYLFGGEGSLQQNLYAFDLHSGEHRLLAEPPDGKLQEDALSPEEVLRRERMRQVSLGITAYRWDKAGGRLLIPYKGDLYILDQPGAGLRRLLESAGKPALDPQFSPNGKWVSYVQDAEIYLLPVEGGTPRQLTHGARGTGKTHGLAEYIAQEEMGRMRGYWWSPDSSQIAFTEVDETHIPTYRIMHQGKDSTGESAQEDHRYPFAGAPNAVVRLAVLPVAGGEPTWMDYSTTEYEYLARVHWLPDGGLAVQMTNRAQDELLLARFDPCTGARSELLRETSEVWINLHNLFTPLKDIDGKGTPGFLWASERTDYRHLYLYDLSGSLVRQLTEGDWMVEEALDGVDEAGRLVYFSATQADPRERHLYRVSLDGGEVQQISQQPGVHQGVLDKGCTRYVDTFASLDQPVKIDLYSLGDGSLLHNLYTNTDSKLEALILPQPEWVEIHNREGDRLYGAIYRPPASFGEGPFPTIISVYGGPHAQRVVNHWRLTASMEDQYFASLGFVVFKLDNHGSARRGLAFEGVIKHRLGQAEVRDQVDGVRYLVERGLADPQRVGIYGWSYGGYMSGLCLMQAPEVFKAAAVGAPVSHFDGYDTHYTEHYMGTPQENPEGYTLGSLQHYVGNLKGKLMLIHGLIDENVHFRHTARLINALIAAGKRYELVLLPDARHMVRKPEDLRYMNQRMADFFLENL